MRKGPQQDEKYINTSKNVDGTKMRKKMMDAKTKKKNVGLSV